MQACAGNATLTIPGFSARQTWLLFLLLKATLEGNENVGWPLFHYQGHGKYGRLFPN